MNNLSYKYKPKNLNEFLGNKDSVAKLKQWIIDISQNKEDTKNAVLISGITGIGKTTLAKMVLNESEYKMHYFNACDVRSSKSLTDNLEKVIYQKKINVKNNKVAILMDELDGMGVGDRGGLGELTKFINPNRGKRTKKNNTNNTKKNVIPIICVNNNIFDKKINELRKDCLDIFLNRIDKREVFNYFLDICKKEKLSICENYLMKIIEDSDSDIRRIFFILQDIIDLKEELTDDKLDEILKNYQKENYDISIYDSTNIIINETLDEKRIIDLFENDRCLLPQMVHENYITNLLNRKNKDNIKYAKKISHSLYLCDYIDKYIYTNQNWDLQKIQPYFGALFPNYYLNQCGELKKKDEPEFSKCLGKTSLQYTNHKNLELLIHELNNKDYNFDDLNLIFKQVMFYVNKGDVFSITKAKELIKKYDLTLVNLEKLAKINKLDETTESSKIKILFRN